MAVEKSILILQLVAGGLLSKETATRFVCEEFLLDPEKELARIHKEQNGKRTGR